MGIGGGGGEEGDSGSGWCLVDGDGSEVGDGGEYSLAGR